MAYLDNFSYEFAKEFYEKVQSGRTRKSIAEEMGIKVHMVASLMRKYGFPAALKGFQKENNVGTRFKKGEWFTIECANCNMEFDIPKYKLEYGAKFCSQSCASSFNNRGENHPLWKGGKKEILNCVFCNKEFRLFTWERNAGKKFCSNKCSTRYHTRDKHWNWQDGATSETERLRHTEEYFTWRLSVYRRDRFKCCHCGAIPTKENPLHAHHKKFLSQYLELAFDINNGITLCKKCHHIMHRKENVSLENIQGLWSGRH